MLAHARSARSRTRCGRGDRRPPGGPGGRVLPLPGADAVVRGLGRAAMALDAQTVTATVRAQVEEHGVSRRGTRSCGRCCAAVGERWAATGEGVEVEHLLADCVTGVLREVAGRARERLAAARCCWPARRTSCTPCRCTRWPPGWPSPGWPAACWAPPCRPPRSGGGASYGPGGAVPLVAAPGTADPAVLTALPVHASADRRRVGGPGWAPAAAARRPVAGDLSAAVDPRRAGLGT